MPAEILFIVLLVISIALVIFPGLICLLIWTLRVVTGKLYGYPSRSNPSYLLSACYSFAGAGLMIWLYLRTGEVFLILVIGGVLGFLDIAYRFGKRRLLRNT